MFKFHCTKNCQVTWLTHTHTQTDTAFFSLGWRFRINRYSTPHCYQMRWKTKIIAINPSRWFDTLWHYSSFLSCSALDHSIWLRSKTSSWSSSSSPLYPRTRGWPQPPQPSRWPPCRPCSSMHIHINTTSLVQKVQWEIWSPNKTRPSKQFLRSCWSQKFALIIGRITTFIHMWW